MTGHYNLGLVLLSFVLAAAGSYLALRLAPAPLYPGQPPRTASLMGEGPAAVTLGLTIWTMHFTGMAAFSMSGMEIGYRWDVTLLSLLVAVVFTSIGFAAISILRDPREALIVAGIPMASGILSMHFLGMFAMIMPMNLHFDAGLVVLSGAIALLASIASLWLMVFGRSRGVLAALAMAMAICGMHYTGMAAARFTSPAEPHAAGETMDWSPA